MQPPLTKRGASFVMYITLAAPTSRYAGATALAMEDKMRTTVIAFCYSAAAFGFVAVLYTGLQNGLV